MHAWYLSRRCQRRCSQALPVNLRNSIKKIWRDFWGGGGDSMCDGGWGLVCPEAHEAAAADGALLQQLELGRSSWFLIGHERQSATPVTAGHGHHHTSGTHTSAELPGLPSLRSSICRREPTNLSVERGGVGESGWKGRRQLRRVQRV